MIDYQITFNVARNIHSFARSTRLIHKWINCQPDAFSFLFSLSTFLLLWIVNLARDQTEALRSINRGTRGPLRSIIDSYRVIKTFKRFFLFDTYYTFATLKRSRSSLLFLLSPFPRKPRVPPLGHASTVLFLQRTGSSGMGIFSWQPRRACLWGQHHVKYAPPCRLSGISSG